MRKIGFFLGMAFLLCLPAAAQESSKADAFLGYSYVRANPATSGAPSFNLNGGSGSVAYYPFRSLGIVADFGGYHASNIGTVYTYLFGPRLTHHIGRVTPFAQVLFGGAHDGSGAISSPASANAFAMTAGGGVDVNATQHIGLRLVQAEYLLTRFQETVGGNRLTQNNARISTGIVFRW